MADWSQVNTQIRFQLEQLSQRNGHHEFEHMCRHLARARICINILPATGPVQGGGDQGRDFETFRTHLANSSIRDSSFVGFTDKVIAFACSLNQAVKGKIEEDVRTIASGGVTVNEIHFFSSRDVSIAIRHELQAWAQDTFRAHLEIYDGAGISEMLCAHDVFWIAERFLHVPGEIVPPAPEQEPKDWYGRILYKWRQETHPAQTYADFVEIRGAANAAKGQFGYDAKGSPINSYKKQEFPFWLDRLDEIAEHGAFDHLRRRALYQASVLRLRGLGTLVGQEERLRQYFAAVPEMKDASEFGDAESLLVYCEGAKRRDQVHLEPREIETWRWALSQRIDERFCNAQRHQRISEQCALLEVRGRIAFHASLASAEGSAVAAAFDYWMQLARLAVEAPLFPLERFANRLAEGADFFGQSPQYEPLTEAVDELLAKRVGAFAVAEKCMKRAKAFEAAGDLARAMAQLHQAKIDWFAPETLDRALNAFLWLSQAYAKQGLWIAAKYYALAAAYIAWHSDDLNVKEFIAHCLFRAADCDYAIGAWHGYLELSEVAAVVYPHYARDPDADFNNPDGVLQIPMCHLTILAVVSNRLHPAIEGFAIERSTRVVQRLGLLEGFAETQEALKTSWEELSEKKLWEALQNQVPMSPWSDAGKVRRLVWQAHGVTWEFEWPNDYDTTVPVEEFLSALQIVLSDMAGMDLVLVRSTIHASVRLLADGESPTHSSYLGFEADFLPSNTEHRCTVTLPSIHTWREGRLSQEDVRIGALSVVMSLLAEVSLLSNEALHDIIGKRLIEGLSQKLLVGSSYGKTLRWFVGRDEFNASDRVAHAPLVSPHPFRSQLPEGIPWFNGTGPDYNSDATYELIRNRYTYAVRPIFHTLQRLRNEPQFQVVVARLRNEGWLDWHILSAVANAAISYRMAQRLIVLPGREAEQEILQKMAFELEPVDALPVPFEEFSEENLRRHLNMGTVMALGSYGLQIHQGTPDFEAIKDFLGCRYNYWIDDIEHEDVLSPDTPIATRLGN